MLQDKVVVAINQPCAQFSSNSGKNYIANSIKEAVKLSSFLRWYHENKFSNYVDDDVIVVVVVIIIQDV